MNVEIKIEPSSDDDGTWCWSVNIDGEQYASGEAESYTGAQFRASAAYKEWVAKQ
jgi:hypothetical protein